MNSQNTRINIIVVNHNTSLFAELAARSFFSMHGQRQQVKFTIMDNASQDGTEELQQYAASAGIEFRQSGHIAAQQQSNSHGEVLRRFVLDYPQCDYYLLVDADICFIMPNTLDTLIWELEKGKDIWAIQAKSGRFTKSFFEGPQEVLTQDVAEQRQKEWRSKRNFYRHTLARPSQGPPSDIPERPRPTHNPLRPGDLDNPTIITSIASNKTRCDPCCTLVKNTAVFRRVADHIGFSGAGIYADFVDIAGIYDTMGLMTEVMNTHEQSYLVSSCGVLHMWKVAYGRNEPFMEVKREQGRNLLGLFRRHDIPNFEGEEWMTPEYLDFLQKQWNYTKKGM